MLDGVVIANETIDFAKRNRKSCILLKVDFEKAYDSVSWSFLDYKMGRFGFWKKWRSWVKCCLKSSSLSVLINGNPTKEFSMSKGLRQGDPMAPFLFLLVAEGLMKKASLLRLYSGIQVGRDNVEISHLHFFLSFFKLPPFVSNSINRILRKFLWGGHRDGRTIAWVGWEKVCTPKNMGGLGLRDLELFNAGSLAKWRWRLLSYPDSLWCKILASRYGELSFYIPQLNSGVWKKCSIWWKDIWKVSSNIKGGNSNLIMG
jgi:hypothetical protein